MSHAEDWKRIAARIRGLTQIGQLSSQLFGERSEANGATKSLGQQCASLVGELQRFAATYANSLPAAPKACIIRFLNERSAFLQSIGSASQSETSQFIRGPISSALVLFASLEVEMAFLLDDAQETIRVRSERALLHLQRMIVADADTRKKWQTAYGKGETECERLGAVHLLAHGIFAFKAHGAGARTDLVYQDRHGPLSEAEKYVDGLTLTEWKVCRNLKDADKAFEQARNQASSYGKGIMGGVELADYRYAIIVSETEVSAVPGDVDIGGVQYRHINIATKPTTPSLLSRKS